MNSIQNRASTDSDKNTFKNKTITRSETKSNQYNTAKSIEYTTKTKNAETKLLLDTSPKLKLTTQTLN